MGDAENLVENIPGETGRMNLHPWFRRRIAFRRPSTVARTAWSKNASSVPENGDNPWLVHGQP